MGHIELVARDKARPAIFNEAHRSKTIPLRFKDPFGMRKWIIDQRRQHWMDNGRHARGTRTKARVGNGTYFRTLFLGGGFFARHDHSLRRRTWAGNLSSAPAICYFALELLV